MNIEISGDDRAAVRKYFRTLSESRPQQIGVGWPERLKEQYLRRRYGSLFDEVLAIMYRHDLEKLASICPIDEYRPETRMVLIGAHKVQSSKQMRMLVSDVFRQMFGNRRYNKRKLNQLADEVWQQLNQNERWCRDVMKAN